MKGRFVGIVVLAATAVAHSLAQAQTDGAVGGYIGLLATPNGGFAPTNLVLGLPENRATTSMQLRYAHWSVSGLDEATNNIGVGITMRHKTVATTLEVGYTHSSNCDGCDAVMGGVDVQFPLGKSPLGSGFVEIGLNPALGIGRPTSGNFNELAMSAAVSLPVAFSMRVGQAAVLVPFISPGFGVGRYRFSGEALSGTRAMLGGGASLAGADWPIQMTASVRKIFIEHSATVFGLGLSLSR